MDLNAVREFVRVTCLRDAAMVAGDWQATHVVSLLDPELDDELVPRIERTLLVGDTGADNGAAIAARVPVVLLDYGYSHVPIKSLVYGTIVDCAEALHGAVMGFVGTDFLVAPDGEVWAA